MKIEAARTAYPGRLRLPGGATTSIGDVIASLRAAGLGRRSALVSPRRDSFRPTASRRQWSLRARFGPTASPVSAAPPTRRKRCERGPGRSPRHGTRHCRRRWAVIHCAGVAASWHRPAWASARRRRGERRGLAAGATKPRASTRPARRRGTSRKPALAEGAGARPESLSGRPAARRPRRDCARPDSRNRRAGSARRRECPRRHPGRVVRPSRRASRSRCSPLRSSARECPAPVTGGLGRLIAATAAR